MDQFESKIVQPLSACLRSHPSSNLKIWFEPGRFFTAESGILLATVNTLKQTPHRTFAGMDSGMNHLLRPAMYDAYHEVVNLSNPSGERLPYDLVGNICESSDFFAKNRPIQELSEGDVRSCSRYGRLWPFHGHNLQYALPTGLKYGLTRHSKYQLSENGNQQKILCARR